MVVISILVLIYYGVTRGVLIVPAGFGTLQVDSLLVLGLFMVVATPLLSIYKWASGRSERQMELIRLSVFIGAAWGVSSWAIRDYLSGFSIPSIIVDFLSFPAIFFGIIPDLESPSSFLLKKMILPTTIGGIIGFITIYSLIKVFEEFS